MSTQLTFFPESGEATMNAEMPKRKRVNSDMHLLKYSLWRNWEFCFLEFLWCIFIRTKLLNRSFILSSLSYYTKYHYRQNNNISFYMGIFIRIRGYVINLSHSLCNNSILAMFSIAMGEHRDQKEAVEERVYLDYTSSL